MKNQINKLFKLAPIFREELKRHVAPNCYHRECPDEPQIEIYFSDGYGTFAFKDEKENISITYYAERIEIKKWVTASQMDHFISRVEQAILNLRGKELPEWKVEIDKKRADLLAQLADLDKLKE